MIAQQEASAASTSVASAAALIRVESCLVESMRSAPSRTTDPSVSVHQPTSGIPLLASVKLLPFLPVPMMVNVVKIKFADPTLLVSYDAHQSVNSSPVHRTPNVAPAITKVSANVLKVITETQMTEPDALSFPKISVSLMLNARKKKCAASH